MLIKKKISGKYSQDKGARGFGSERRLGFLFAVQRGLSRSRCEN
jgi:hypothetical protein